MMYPLDEGKCNAIGEILQSTLDREHDPEDLCPADVYARLANQPYVPNDQSHNSKQPVLAFHTLGALVCNDIEDIMFPRTNEASGRISCTYTHTIIASAIACAIETAVETGIILRGCTNRAGL